MLILAMISVGLRIAFRLREKKRLTLSDISITLALLPSSAFFAFIIHCKPHDTTTQVPLMSYVNAVYRYRLRSGARHIQCGTSHCKS